MKAWIKLHTEIIDDPKIGRLSFADKGLWLCLLALAGKIDDRAEDGTLTGRIGSVEDITWLLRTQTQDIQPGIERMTTAEMLHMDGDILFVTHFADRQETQSETPSAVATRVKRHRAAAKQNSNATVTDGNETVTAPKRPRIEKNREDTEAEQNREESDNNNARAEQMRARVAAVAAARSVTNPVVVAPPPAATTLDATTLDATTLATGNAEVDRATKALTELGIEPTTIRKIVTHAPYAHIIGWANYARNQPGLQNPAGYVIKMLREQQPPPRDGADPPRKTWFTAEEEALFFGPDKKPQPATTGCTT